MNGGRLAIMLAVTLVMACSSSSSPSLESASLGGVEYGAPAGWTSKDMSTPRFVSIEWTPAENDAKKRSLTIIRAERPALVANLGHVERLLVDALRNLPSGSFAPATRFTTRHGFSAIRVEGTFVPPGQARTYWRMHAILVVDNALVHVMSTAVISDREEFDAVVESFQRKDA